MSETFQTVSLGSWVNKGKRRAGAAKKSPDPLAIPLYTSYARVIVAVPLNPLQEAPRPPSRGCGGTARR